MTSTKPSGTKSIVYRVIPVLVLALSVALLQGCMNTASGEEPAAEQEPIEAVPVEAADVVLEDVAAVYAGTAALEADRRALAVAKISGVILELNAEEGDFVEEGQILARIETDRYALEVSRTGAELKRLETDFQRKQDLYQRELVSAEEFEQVRANFDAQKAAYGLAQLDLEYTEIRAPISGYVSERMIRVGNLVSVTDPTFSIASYDPLLAVLHVPEREMPIIRNGLPVTVAVDAWPDETFDGKVIRISPVVDAGTGTFRVTAKIDDPETRLKPGLFGRVSVLYDTRESVPVVPRTALITEDNATHVFVVNEDGTAGRRSVQLGYTSNGSVEVIDGLSAGERVVTAGKGSLSDGTSVEVIGDEPSIAGDASTKTVNDSQDV